MGCGTKFLRILCSIMGDPSYPPPRLPSDEKLNMIFIGRTNAYFLDIFPIRTITAKVIRKLCSFRYSNNDYQNDIEFICSINKHQLTSLVGRSTRRLRQIFSADENAGNEGSVESRTSVLFSFLSKKNAILFVLTLLLSAVISILSFVDFLDMYVLAIIVHWILRIRWVRSMLVVHPEWDLMLRNISADFYLGLVIHTSTPILMVNSLFPYPYADFYGLYGRLLFKVYVIKTDFSSF